MLGGPSSPSSLGEGWTRTWGRTAKPNQLPARRVWRIYSFSLEKGAFGIRVLARRCATLAGSGSFPKTVVSESILASVSSGRLVRAQSRPRPAGATLNSRLRGLTLETAITGSRGAFSIVSVFERFFGWLTIIAFRPGN